MPIDFAAVADRYREALLGQTRPTIPLFQRLAEAVKRLDERAQAAERATRAYPVLRYRNGAVCVRVDALGAPPLAHTAPMGFVAELREGGREFLAGLSWTSTAWEQELALPRLVSVGAEALAAAEASVARFARPGPAMLDARERRLSDALGLLVLGYNSLLGSQARDQLLGVAGAAGRSLADYRTLSPAGSEGPRAGSAGRGIVATLEEAGVGVLDLVVLLPAMGEALAVALREGSLGAKRRILSELGKVEATAHGLRAGAIDGLIRAADLGGLATRLLAGARIVVLIDVEILTRVGPWMLDAFLTGLRGFSEGLTAWGTWLTDLAEAVRSVIDTVMRFDLLGFVLRQVLPGWILKLLPDLPTVTVDDVISLLLGLAVTGVRDVLDAFFESALFVLSAPFVPDEWFYTVADLQEIFGIVLTPRPFTLPPDVMPAGPLAGFPDVYQELFGGGRAAALVDAVDRFGAAARAGARTSLEGAATMAADLGASFAAEAERAAGLGSPARLRELAAGASDMAERVFGPEHESARRQAAARRPDALAGAFEDAVATGGFALVGAAIPAYIGEMRSFWAARRPPDARPTSPHILARHGRLGGVRVPRMTVRAPARRADAELAGLVAQRFHEAVGEAYLDGRRRFEALRDPPARRAPRGTTPPRRGAGRGR